jgi:tellurite resistance protein
MTKASVETTAACGAYLLVALADARVASIEEARFLGGVVNHPAFKNFKTEALAGEYNRLLAGLRADWRATENEILHAIAEVKGKVPAIAAIKVAAQQAVVADHIIKPQEETMLARIAAALGLTGEDL